MGQRRNDHGGLLSPQDALYHATHDYPHGGLGALAARLGTSADVLRKKVDPQYITHQAQFKEFEQVLRFTRDERLIDSIMHPIGAVWQFEQDLTEHPGELDLLGNSNRLMNKAVLVINELETALSNDGKVDENERAKITQRLFDLSKEMKNFSHTADQFTEDK